MTATVPPSNGRAPERRSMSVPRVALTKVEAAEALGMSVDSLERYVMPDVRVIRKGKLRLISVAELERWADRNAARVLDG